jgi:hypothetical protein
LPKSKKTKAPQKESFVSWFQKNKQKLEEEFSDVDSNQLMKNAYTRFKESISVPVTNKTEDDDASKKRKLSDEQDTENNLPKRSASNKLAAFARDN